MNSGTSEPVVQVVGDCRLIVELPGETDPARARSIVQRTAFLEFRITDSRDELERALPAMDAALRRAGVASETSRPRDIVSGLLRDTSESSATEPSDRPLSSLARDRADPGRVVHRRHERCRQPSGCSRTRTFNDSFLEDSSCTGDAHTIQRDGETYRGTLRGINRPIIGGDALQKATAGRDPDDQRRSRCSSSSRAPEAASSAIGDRQKRRQPPRDPARRTRAGSAAGDHQSHRRAWTDRDGRQVARGGERSRARSARGRASGPAARRRRRRRSDRHSAPTRFATVCARRSSPSDSCSCHGRLLRPLGVARRRRARSLRALTARRPRRVWIHADAAGLAGFALSIGMAVDANVLIFERIREEMDAGKPARTAVDARVPRTP